MKLSVDFNNFFVLFFLIGSVLSFLVNQVLEFVDFKARKRNGGKLPELLQSNDLAKSIFDEAKLKNICNYENSKYFLWIFSSTVQLLLSVILVISGFYPFIFNLISSFAGDSSTIGSCFVNFFLFLLIVSIPSSIISIPFDLYSEFKLEKKYGFGKMTFKLWLADGLKEIVLSVLLSALLTFAASFLFIKCASFWWAILAAILILFSLVMQVIYPKFIAPLFNKFTPLEEGELKEKIQDVLKKTGFENGGLFVMDASKRSGHSNAFFSGFGKSKRIVLYDTLIKQMTNDEIVSVLGHELGHFKLHHITKRLIKSIFVEFAALFILFELIQIPSLYSGFGFGTSTVPFVGLFLIVTIFSAVSDLLSPLTNFSSRKDEYEADAFSAKVCGSGQNLISGLIKLNSENLSELLPPDIYVFWNFSHPSLCQRIGALQKLDQKNSSSKKV